MSKNTNKDELRLLPQHNRQEFFRKRIGELNGKGIEMDYHEGKDDSNIDYSNFPKEFFLYPMTYKDKINLILEKKEITIGELAREISFSKEEIENPNKKVYEALANFSSYPIEFFTAKPIQNIVKTSNIKRWVIGISIVVISLAILIGTFIYIFSE